MLSRRQPKSNPWTHNPIWFEYQRWYEAKQNDDVYLPTYLCWNGSKDERCRGTMECDAWKRIDGSLILCANKISLTRVYGSNSHARRERLDRPTFFSCVLFPHPSLLLSHSQVSIDRQNRLFIKESTKIIILSKRCDTRGIRTPAN